MNICREMTIFSISNWLLIDLQGCTTTTRLGAMESVCGGQECIHNPNLLFKLGKKSCHMMISNCKFTNNKELISKLGHLRVFSLSGYGISETPNSFYGLKHLIQEMIIYYNLQMLILSSYKHLTKIPIWRESIRIPNLWETKK